MVQYSNYFFGDEELTNDDNYIDIARVSKPWQKHQLKNYIDFLRNKKCKGNRVGKYQIVVSGKDPRWLEGVIKKAEAKGADTLRFCFVNRYLRAPEFHPVHNWRAQPDEIELNLALKITKKFKVVIATGPDLDPITVRDIMSNIIAKKKNKGGRPKKMSKKERRGIFKPQVIKLYQKGLLTQQQIGRKLNLPQSTISAWINSSETDK